MSILQHILDVTNRHWAQAARTKGLVAKPTKDCVDTALFSRMKLDAVDGPQPLKADAYVCMGVGGDTWQESWSSLTAEYLSVSLGGGWVHLHPKPSKPIEFFIVTAQDVAHIPRFHDRKVGAGFIIGLEGFEIEGVRCLKSFNIGDVIIRDPDNHADVKVIHRKIFDGIYEPGA
jgi:hypothetical protein